MKNKNERLQTQFIFQFFFLDGILHGSQGGSSTCQWPCPEDPTINQRVASISRAILPLLLEGYVLRRSNKSFSTSLLLSFISIPNGIQHILRETGNLYSHTSLFPAFSRSCNVFLCKRGDFLPFDSGLAIFDSQSQQEFLPLFCWTLHKLPQNDDVVPFRLKCKRRNRSVRLFVIMGFLFGFTFQEKS